MASRWVRLVRLVPDWGGIAFEGLVLPRRDGPARIVQAVVLDAGRVLLATRRTLGGWELPGGNVRPGEDDEPALRREVREETGLEVEIVGHVGDYRRSGFRPHLARVFRCQVRGGSLRPSLETPRVEWFPAQRPPPGLLPWFRGPLEDALREPASVEREEHQGVAAIWAGVRTDLAARWRGE